MTGGRITAIMINSFLHLDEQVGAATMCVGDGRSRAIDSGDCLDAESATATRHAAHDQHRHRPIPRPEGFAMKIFHGVAELTAAVGTRLGHSELDRDRPRPG